MLKFAKKPDGIVWNEAFSVGVKQLDDQHKRLLTMINHLAECLGNVQVEKSVHEIMAEMFDYTQTHFTTEEAYLRRICFPDFAAHVLEHNEFIEKMAEFSMASSNNTLDITGVHQYLLTWFQSHILESDMQYRRFTETIIGSKKNG